MYPSRTQVDISLASALGVHGLAEYTDALLDTLDMFVEWGDNDE